VTRAVLSLGSNLGDRYAHLLGAVAGLGDSVLVLSGVYETPPWGDDDQPPYLNAVVLVAELAAGPMDWLVRARELEAAAGRVRDPQRRFGPRTLDVDVLTVWQEDGTPVLSDDPELTLPHPRVHERAFVMRPWIDIQPYGQVPGRGWLTDLLNAESMTGQVSAMTPRPDLPLESDS
jgi:2-amino-4-hydroxy-6-hydroxymethyldihydropteridine diphosphokinase